MLTSILILLFQLGIAIPTTDYEQFIPTLDYYDNKHECDIREGGFVQDYYVADCGFFWLVLDYNNLYRSREWKHNY